MPEISVIVPVYKAEAFLPKCIESILNQTFSDLELILVDDGSPDNSGRICDDYAARDGRVRVIHQENQGQSVARNNAIAQMAGQWVLFCDSDDWIHPETLERLYQAAREYGTEICIGGYAETTGEDPVIPEADLIPEIWTPKAFYMERFINATIPVVKLIHRDCLGDLRFPVGKYIDDEYIMYRLLFTQEKLVVIPAAFYAYFVNTASLTKRAWNVGRLDAWDAYEQQIAFFEALGDQELVNFRYRGYLENAMVNWEAAQNAPNREELAKTVAFMKKRIRSVIRRAWKAGAMDFWIDYDLLYRFYPLLTRGYRFWLDKIRRG